MVRGWIASSERERQLAIHVEGAWGPKRRETLTKRIAIFAIIVIAAAAILFLWGVTSETNVPEQYAVAFSASGEIYIGHLDLNEAGFSSLAEADITLTLEIPEWDVKLTRECTYFTRGSGSARLDYLSLTPITGQVVGKKSRDRVEFVLNIKIVTPHPDVAKIKFLGKGNTIRGTVTNHPDEPMFILTDAGSQVRTLDSRTIEVQNSPPSEDAIFWTIKFTSTRLS
jgi:hypothetical protein